MFRVYLVSITISNSCFGNATVFYKLWPLNSGLLFVPQHVLRMPDAQTSFNWVQNAL